VDPLPHLQAVDGKGPVGLETQAHHVAVAQAAYDNREVPSGLLNNDRLRVLADALLDAGCPEGTLQEQHLRSGGRHFRGCHALDPLLNPA
jgi:hypothetical protein